MFEPPLPMIAPALYTTVNQNYQHIVNFSGKVFINIFYTLKLTLTNLLDANDDNFHELFTQMNLNIPSFKVSLNFQ